MIHLHLKRASLRSAAGFAVVAAAWLWIVTGPGMTWLLMAAFMAVLAVVTTLSIRAIRRGGEMDRAEIRAAAELDRAAIRDGWSR